MRRSKISKRRSRRIFSRTATRTHSKNLQATPVRGGFAI